MPLIHRSVGPKKLSSGKLELKGKTDSEFIAVNNETLVNVLRQLASVVTHAGDIFSDVATLTEQVGKRVRSVKLRLHELEAKADLFDPRLVPVPEGTLDDISNACGIHHTIHRSEEEGSDQMRNLVASKPKPRFLIQLYENAGRHQPVFPPRSPILSSRKSLERQISTDSRRPASFAALRDWKLDDYLDEKIATLDRKKQSAEQLNRALASPFPSQVVQVDVTGAGFDRMKANRRSLVIHTKKIRKKRRNTICGSMPNKECGIQTSFTSVASPGGTTGDEDGEHHHHGTSDDHSHSHHNGHTKKYGIDSGHWSSCTSSAQGVPGIVGSSCSAPSPWDPTSLSTSSDFLFDDEDRCLTPQLENFTDGLVSDSDSVDTDGYFTSFRSDCGFPRMKKSASTKELEDLIAKSEKILERSNKGTTEIAGDKNELDVSKADQKGGVDLENSILMNCSSTLSSANSTIVNAATGGSVSNGSSLNPENEYELFGKGSTSTTASSCGTVVLRSKPDPPTRTTSNPEVMVGVDGKSSVGQICDNGSTNEDSGLEERVKRKSLIERVPSMVVVTPSPSCSSGSPPPLKDPGTLNLADGNISTAEDSEQDSGRLTPKADDLLTTNESECGTLSDTDSDRRTEVRLSDIAVKKRSTSSTSSTGTASTSNSTLTLTSCPLNGNSGGLPQPDVIPAEAVVQQLQIIRTSKATPKLDANKEYYSLDTVLLGSFEEELTNKKNAEHKDNEVGRKNEDKNGGSKEVVSSPSPTSTSSNSMREEGKSTSGKIRGARVVLDANGEIIFSSETLRRKRKQKVSFDPGSAVKSPDYDSNSTYARVRESVYDRIKKPTGDPEKLYECIEEIRRHNLTQRDPFLEAQKLKHEQNNNDSRGELERRVSSASPSSTISSSSPSKSSSTPDNSKNVVLETDLDSAIPPVMPDLKNLPRIKDRLKRNESYRIANTDDLPGSSTPTSTSSPTPIQQSSKISPGAGHPPRRSPLSPLHLNRNGLSSLAKRMNLTSPNSSSGLGSTSPTPLHLNKKRDIPEEDPNFIQQIFSMNSAANNQLRGGVGNQSSSSINSSNGPSHNIRSPENSSKITLSKFTLSPDDRPSFLRRDSPPTMDEIAKEIYRFRKKFNIQPNQSTTALTRNTSPVTPTTTSIPFGSSTLGGSFRRKPELTPTSRPMPRSSSSIGHYYNQTINPSASLPRSATTSGIMKSTIPAGFPKLSVEPSKVVPPRSVPSPSPSSATTTPPFRTSTPIKRPSSYTCYTPTTPSPLTTSSITPSPIYYPSYGWGPSPPSKPSTPLGAYNTIERMGGLSETRQQRSGIPPVPPTRSFGSGRKIFPIKPSPTFTNGPTSTVQSHNVPLHSSSNDYNQYQSATLNKNDSSLRYKDISNNSNGILINSNNNNYSIRKSILPSLPFRRNSVAFAESSPSSFSPSIKPRTSLGEFKRLLQASQKKRNSISAVEVLKPKGLETSL